MLLLRRHAAITPLFTPHMPAELSCRLVTIRHDAAMPLRHATRHYCYAPRHYYAVTLLIITLLILPPTYFIAIFR